MFHNRFIERASATLFVAVALGALGSAARAQGLTVKTDEAKVNGGTADFGSGTHAVGSPTGSGTVKWILSTVGGLINVKARVQGTLYLDSLDPGCARLTVEFKNKSGAILSTKTKDVCVTVNGHNANDQTNKASIDEEYASAHLYSVLLRTNLVLNNQVVNPGTSKGVSLPDLYALVLFNNGNSDFGDYTHAAGTPIGPAGVHFTIFTDGQVNASVVGELYYDSLFSEGCAQLIIDFQTASGSTLESKKIKKCGPGGNANDRANNIDVIEDYTNGSLFQVRLRVGQVLQDGSFIRVESKTCDFKDCH